MVTLIVSIIALVISVASIAHRLYVYKQEQQYKAYLYAKYADELLTEKQHELEAALHDIDTHLD